MIRKFKITNTSDGKHVGTCHQFETKISQMNTVEFHPNPLRTTMFNGMCIKLVDGEYVVDGQIK